MSRSVQTDTGSGYSLTDIVGVVAEAQTYRNLLYLLLAFPLGMAYFIFLTVGISLGVGLAVLGVGLAILFGTLLGVRVLGSFERSLANRLLGTDLDSPDDVESADGVVGTVQAYLQASSTWRALGFVFLKFWLGILSFVLLLTFLGAAVEFLLLPVFPDGAINLQIGDWEPAKSLTTTAEQALAVPAGAVLGIIALHLLNAVARVNASIAEALLDGETNDSVERAEAA